MPPVRAWLGRLEEGFIAFLLAGMTIITFVQVVARYIFNFSFVWALELTSVLFAWMIFLGIPYGVRIGSHIGVDALVKSLGPKAARVFGAIAALLCIVYSAILLYGSWAYVAKIYAIEIVMQDLPIPQWMPRAILVFSFALLILRFAQVFWHILQGKERGMHLSDEAADALKLQAEMGEEERRNAAEGPK